MVFSCFTPAQIYKIVTGRTLGPSEGGGFAFEVLTSIEFDWMESFRVHSSRVKHNVARRAIP